MEGPPPTVSQRWAAIFPAFALKVRAADLDRILRGEQSVEIRGATHHVRERVFLMESETGRVRASATPDAPRPLTSTERSDHAEALAFARYRMPWAWPLNDVREAEEPWVISPEARRGCPTWVPRARWERYPENETVDTGVTLPIRT